MGLEDRILVASHTKRDGELTASLLRKWGMECRLCSDTNDLCQKLDEGTSCVVVAREFLEPDCANLIACIEKQPAWSHPSFVILASSGDLQEANGRAIGLLESLKNVTILERPVRLKTLLSVARAAIADRRRQYQTRDLLAQLERKNEELEQFSYIASHDLQEPLRMVSSYVQLLEKRFGNCLDEDGRTYIRFAVEGTRRMQRLIYDLLTYAKAGNHQRKERVDLNEVITHVTQSLRLLVQETGAELNMPLQLPTVEGDENSLSQLFQNLIGNAIKFRKTGTVPRVEVDSSKRGREWIFCVRDNGIGMEPGDLKLIFKPFQRLHREEHYPGSGIGLALCEKIVRRHGGAIWAESIPGEGSAFYFSIPLADTDANSNLSCLPLASGERSVVQ